MNPRPAMKCDCKVINGGTNAYAERVIFCPLHAAAPEMLETIRWIAQTVHQAYHMDQSGTFKECPKNTYDAATQTLTRAEGKQ